MPLESSYNADVKFPAPTEVWDHIADYIVEPSDLLSFALVNSHLRDLIIPGHLNYSRLVAYPHNEGFWSGLTVRQAQRIRELYLISEIPDNWVPPYYSTVWPPSPSTEPDSEEHCCEYEVEAYQLKPPPPSYFIKHDFAQVDSSSKCSADCEGQDLPPWTFSFARHVATMTGLLKLVLHLTLCDLERLRLISTFANFDSALDDLEVHIVECETIINPDIEVRRGLEFTKALMNWKGNFSRFSWHSDWDRADTQRILKPIVRLLKERCPELRELELALTSSEDSNDPHAASLELWDANWPLLHTLSLHGVTAPDESSGETFLGATKVRVFRATAGTICCDYFSRPLNYLLDLELDDSNVGLIPILFGMYRGPLQPIRALRLHLSFDIPATLANPAMDTICVAGSRSGTLERLVYNVREPSEDQDHENPTPSSHVFWLRMIGMCNPGISELWTRPSRFFREINEFEDVLRAFPNLQTLYFNKDWEREWWANDHYDDYQSCINSLEQVCPKLRRVEEFVKDAEDVWRDTCRLKYEKAQERSNSV